MRKTIPKMVDEILQAGPYDWAPPIERYAGVDDGIQPPSWEAEYRALAAHHEFETCVLYAVIREMRKRLGGGT